MSVYRPALRPSARTWFVLFLTSEDDPAFQDHCAVMPSTWVAEHLERRGDHTSVWVTPGLTGRMAQCRVPRAELGSGPAELLGGVAPSRLQGRHGVCGGSREPARAGVRQGR